MLFLATIGALALILLIAFIALPVLGPRLKPGSRLQRIAAACAKLWMSADKLGNVAEGGEAVSLSRHGGEILLRRAKGDKRPGDWRWCLFCRFLDLFQKDHCLKAADPAQKAG